MTTQNPTKHEFYHSTMWMEDSILFCTYKPDLVINLEVARDLVMDRATLFSGEKNAVLIDCSELVYINQAARDYLSSENACECIAAIAMISNNTFMKIVAKAFVMLDKPSATMRFCESSKEAIDWLCRFKNQD